jgi:hypothetical protein
MQRVARVEPKNFTDSGCQYPGRDRGDGLHEFGQDSRGVVGVNKEIADERLRNSQSEE